MEPEIDMLIIPYVTAVVASLLLGLLLIPTVIKICHRYRILDMPGAHKRHKVPTPNMGGVALFVAVWLTVGVSLLIFGDLYREILGSLVYILAGALIILLVGLSDDLSPVSAWVKLCAQVAVGLVLYMGGLRVELLSTPFGSVDIGYFSVVLTVLWVVVLTNAINLIDGLDGLASGVSLIGATTLVVIGWLYEVGPVLVFLLALIGFLAPFLYYNRHPARIFLGDSGSMQIGYYFAVFSLMIPLKSFTATALYVPVLALGVPIIEVLSSFVRRLLRGKNVMKADRRHLFHYLALVGFSPRRVVTIFYLLAIIYGLFAIAMFYFNRVVLLTVLALFMVVIFAVFFILVTKFATRKRLSNGRGAKSGL
ncbi:MAG: undecaprenyl/decaprenyl-phosphate alpha-N-acetylglucosaminyl 1-phosphate transferase [candidate division Zixibacteria bacterium]|nr:undecaprenyl/decaprenyl-phosphate alpha-N-acetylglucosaminyl 1-phosphate transferase [candidate division Zixibacteria bacterium]